MYYDPYRYQPVNVYLGNQVGDGMNYYYGSLPVERSTYHPVTLWSGDSPLHLNNYGPAHTYHHQPGPLTTVDRYENNEKNAIYFGRTPDEWITHTDFLVKEGLEDVKRGINATHILQEFILMGVLVGKGYPPEEAYKTVEEWERSGASKLLQQSKNM